MLDFIKETISEKDLETIDAYRKLVLKEPTGRHRTADITTILKPWASAKSAYLYRLLNNSLIFTKPIEVNQSNSEIERYYDTLDTENITSDFLWILRTETRPYLVTPSMYYDECLFLFTKEAFITNIYNGKREIVFYDEKKDKKLKIPIGTKLIKAYNKIIDFFELSDVIVADLVSKSINYGGYRYRYRNIFGEGTFKEFVNLLRDWQSMARNQHLLKGELCLSIHPLDYMTMSDNACDWSSCMSWLEDGDYRQGTVEMMNSSCVIVAYLTASSSFSFGYDNIWNNKKWRQLFIINQEAIIGIKSYPYCNDELTKVCIKTLQDLAKTNLNWEYSEDFYEWHGRCYIRNHTTNLVLENTTLEVTSNGYMYTDMGALNYHFLVINEDLVPSHYNSIYYSGESECMNCGETNIDIDPSDLMCNTCFDKYDGYCDCCGRALYEDDMYYFGDSDSPYCEDCFNNVGFYCSSCEQSYRNDDGTAIYIVEDTNYYNNKPLKDISIDKLKYKLVCENCYNRFLDVKELSEPGGAFYFEKWTKFLTPIDHTAIVIDNYIIIITKDIDKTIGSDWDLYCSDEKEFIYSLFKENR